MCESIGLRANVFRNRIRGDGSCLGCMTSIVFKGGFKSRTDLRSVHGRLFYKFSRMLRLSQKLKALFMDEKRKRTFPALREAQCFVHEFPEKQTGGSLSAEGYRTLPLFPIKHDD